MPTLRLVPAGPSRRPLSRMRTAASAYRADIATRGNDDAFCQNDGIWIAVGSMLSTAANLEDADRGAKIVHDALELAKEALGAERLARGNRLDPPGRSAPCNGDVIRLLSEQAEDCGALNSAALILDAYLAADRGIEQLDMGRIIAHSARVARRQGETDVALSRYKDVERIGRACDDDELRTRAWIGYGLVARERGNFPIVRRWMAKAGDMAQAEGYAALGALTHNVLCEASAKGGDIDTALVHGWTALRLVAGDVIDEAPVLANLGALLLTANHPRAAKAVLLRLLTRPVTATQAITTLGSLALAAARSDDFRATRWAVSEIDRLVVELTLARYQTAEALADCAEALIIIGARGEALSTLERAETISRKHAFHELNYRIESLRGRETVHRQMPRTLAPEAAVIAGELADLMPAEVPLRVELALAS